MCPHLLKLGIIVSSFKTWGTSGEVKVFNMTRNKTSLTLEQCLEQANGIYHLLVIFIAMQIHVCMFITFSVI